MMRSFVKEWRYRGMGLIIWVDDVLFVAPDDRALLSNLNVAIPMLLSLGVPISFTKSYLGHKDEHGVYHGHTVVEFVGLVLHFGLGRIFLKRSKYTALLTLIRQVEGVWSRGKSVKVIELARICGRIISAMAALVPARIMTRSLFALMSCRCAADYNKVAKRSPGATDELVFWSRCLHPFALLGGPMFPDMRPYTLVLHADAGPGGSGMRAEFRNVDGAVSLDVGHIAEGDAWHDSEAQSDQVVRELAGLERALHAAVRSKRVTLAERGVRMYVRHEEGAI